MLARACISSIAYSRDLSWEQYDLWMTLPRLFGFVACLVIINRYGGLRLWGWHAGFSRRGLFLLALIVAAYIAHYASSVRLYHNTVAELWMGWATTVAVVLFEESSFRGLMYLSLRQRYGAAGAAALSSVLFTLYHWQAQPISEWPQIFAYGMVACSALELGTGLVWVAVAHAIIDGLWFHFGSGRGFQHPAYMTASFLCYIAALWLALRWNLKSRKVLETSPFSSQHL